MADLHLESHRFIVPKSRPRLGRRGRVPRGFDLQGNLIDFRCLVYAGRLAGVAGIEPANAGTKNRCLTTWLHPSRRAPL